MKTIPITFFSTNGISLNNYSANDVIIQSDATPQGHIRKLKDLNTIFTTSGGTLAYEVLHASGGATRFADNRTANDNGSFETVVGQGDRLQIVLTATGTGVIDVVWHGEDVQVREVNQDNVLTISEFGDGI